jgi:hypothetical protein
MDWAICKIEGHRVGDNITPCQTHVCRKTSHVIPGGRVFAVGRTSGLQDGIINGCLTNLRFWDGDSVSRESDEWSIIKPESMPDEKWATAGMGVSGDSGAWVLEAGTDNVVGQLWGRDFQEEGNSFGQIITYFTPILDILDDIYERTKASQIYLYTGLKGSEKETAKKRANLIGNCPPIGIFPRESTMLHLATSQDSSQIEMDTAQIYVSEKGK